MPGPDTDKDVNEMT